jgi:hypothetical protein
MIEEVNINPIRDFLETSSSRQPDSAGPHPNDDEDVSVQVDYAYLIDEAMQSPQTDTQAVQRARELLLSGELESPENILEAAENIVTFGI